MSGKLFKLPGNFSNCLVRIECQALSTRKCKLYTVSLEWILGKARGVHETLTSPITFNMTPLAPAALPHLPVYIVAKLEDVRTMDLVATGPHEIVLVSIDAFRDAPLYFSIIKQKASRGGFAANTPLTRPGQAICGPSRRSR